MPPRTHWQEVTDPGLRPHVSDAEAYFLLLKILFICREGGREGEREGEKHHCVVASRASPAGAPAATQACALTGNWTSNPLVHRQVLNPLSHTSLCF